MTLSTRLFVGLMSGTSADSIDAALVAFEGNQCRLITAHNEPLAASLKSQIHSLTLSGHDEIARMGELDQQLGDAFAEATIELLKKAGVSAGAVTAIGSHGQTIRHQPGHDKPGHYESDCHQSNPHATRRFSLQIADPNIIAERTGILTVADFRRRDIACGGQGAPLAPGFHKAQLGSPHSARCILNIGGIANITSLPVAGPVLGFDTGPGNTLMDAWIQQHLNMPYDRNGAWAASGSTDTTLLGALLQHPFLQLQPPKSTGREDFNLEWLQTLLNQLRCQPRPADVQATLLEFTAMTIADAIRDTCDAGTDIFVCGGGAHNGTLIKAIQRHLPATAVKTTNALGVDPDWVEAVAFAWLAKQYVDNKPGNLPAVTGACREAVLGAAYPV